jgi:hypothetical protein
MKTLLIRWWNLKWYEKIAITPLVLVIGILMILVSPVIAFLYCCYSFDKWTDPESKRTESFGRWMS